MNTMYLQSSVMTFVIAKVIVSLDQIYQGSKMALVSTDIKKTSLQGYSPILIHSETHLTLS